MSDTDTKPELEIVDETDELKNKLNGTDVIHGDDDDGEEERRVKREDDEDGLGGNPDETPEERRARNQEKRRLRKQKKEQAIQRTSTELRFLEKRNEELEKRLLAIEQHSVQQAAGSIESEIARMQTQLKQAETVFANATAAQNGQDAATALRYRDEARDKLRELEEQRAAFAEARQRPVQPQGPDPAVLRHAKEFMRENPWYDPKAADEDSAVMLALDQTLAREGYDPRTEEYWEELRERGRKRLPDRFGDDTDDIPPARNQRQQVAERKPKGSPVLGSGRDQAPPNKERFMVSAERKAAMQELGVWDDPVLREKYVRKYMEWDKANPGGRR